MSKPVELWKMLGDGPVVVKIWTSVKDPNTGELLVFEEKSFRNKDLAWNYRTNALAKPACRIETADGEFGVHVELGSEVCTVSRRHLHVVPDLAVAQ